MNNENKPSVISSVEQNYPQFDAVVALGKNWRRSLSGEVFSDQDHDYRIYLSLESKMTALAAGQLYKDGKVGKIIFSTGETAGKDPNGNSYPTEAEEMKRFMRIFFSEDEIPESAIETETNSFDTAGNAEEVGKMLQREHIESVALLSVGFHLPRAKKLFKNYGVRVEKTIGSEGILKGRNPHYEKLIHDYHWSKQYLVELGKEAVGVGLVYSVDPRGEKLRQQTLKSRHRE